MKLFRVLSMVTALLATAGAAHAQIPSSLQPSSPFPYPLEQISECPTPAWHIKACNDVVFVFQQVRALCTSAQQQAGCCQAAATAAQPKACACAKACACCETCKAKKETAHAQPMPLTPEMMRRMAGLHGITPQPTPLAMPFPVAQPPSCMPPMASTPGVVQIMPVPGARVIQLVQVTHQVNPVRLVTPELEAHCERMHHRGDMVILEGNVLLVCKKHAQPIRVEAQRVMVNMRDGSYTVESGTPTTTFGVQRTGSLMLGTGINSDNGGLVAPMPPATAPVTQCPGSTSQSPTPYMCPLERSGIFRFWTPIFP